MGKKVFGKLPDGREVFIFELENKNGMRIRVSEYGAILVSLEVPDREGKLRDVVLGYDSLEEYQVNGCFFGSTIGRNGNRVKGAGFQLNGRRVSLVANEGENNLHSGPDGFEKKLWKGEQQGNSVKLSRMSPDGENGFPGNFSVSVTYTLTEDNGVEIFYQGSCDQDTVANLTNHSYFNLAGHASGPAMDQSVRLFAGHYTPVDGSSIPTGEIAQVAGTPMDFRREKEIGAEIGADFEQLKLTGGYDHNYVLDKPLGSFGPMAEAWSRRSGILMKAYTDCPGVQFYAGNFIKDETGKGGAHYPARSGYCFESQYYPDAVNREGFPSPVLRAGEKYESKTAYYFSIR